jgi:hypothetical protein
MSKIETQEEMIQCMWAVELAIKEVLTAKIKKEFIN